MEVMDDINQQPPESSVQQPSEQTPVAQHPQTRLMIFAAILVAFLLSIIAYYLGTTQNQPLPQNQIIPKPSPTQTQPSATDSSANWKTYINNKYGYSLKYPSAYTVDDQGPSVSFIPNNYGIKRQNGELLGIIAVEQVAKQLNPLTKTEDYIKDVLFAPPDHYYAGATFKSLTVDHLGDATVYRISTDVSPETKSAQTFIRVGDALYYFIFQTGGGYPQSPAAQAKNYADYESILSTFKFTPPSSVETQQTCPTPPSCPPGKNLIHGEPGPSSESQCPLYQCL